MAAGLQMVKQFVPCGKLVVAGNTQEAHFLLHGKTFYFSRLEHTFFLQSFKQKQEDFHLDPKKKKKQMRKFQISSYLLQSMKKNINRVTQN